jgi:aminoglycoside phosphotransferase family enzyme/predicted kinase
MLEPGFYAPAPASVELRETHISWVFLAGELAYKVKKPVVFPFLDYGTLERRREMCHEEVRLNRRLAPEIYLRVVAVVPRPGGRYELAAEEDPAAIEYAVEMRRVEEDRSLAVLAPAGALEPAQVEAVARRLASFHGDASPAPIEARDVGLLVSTLEENLTTLREAGAEAIGESALRAAERFTDAFLASRRGELAARAKGGLIRDCHGDLRAEHVIVPAAGAVYVYDCVEFNPALRQIDVAADISFLVMDLARLGTEELALALVAAYRRFGGDPGDDGLLSFFATYRAWVRAKIACLRALELARADAGRERGFAEARELFRLGRRFAWRARAPVVIVICGVAASGKTTLAAELASRSGWAHLSSDLTRKRLARIAPTARGATDLYSREYTDNTYRELGRTARAALEYGGGVLVDATFHRRSEREAFRAGLGDIAAPLLFVECRVPIDVLLARARARALEADHVSDAGPAIVERQLAEREPLAEMPRASRTTVEADTPADQLADEVEAFVDRRLSESASGVFS